MAVPVFQPGRLPLIRVLLVEDLRSDAIYPESILETSTQSQFVVDRVERLSDALRLVQTSR